MPRYCHQCGNDIKDYDPLHCSLECARESNKEVEALGLTAEEERGYYGLDRPGTDMSSW